jgi:hypothetical protein
MYVLEEKMANPFFDPCVEQKFQDSQGEPGSKIKTDDNTDTGMTAV